MVRFSMYEGLWLKGSIHCHSNLSDGLLSPDNVANSMRKEDIHFFL
ncbi:MAG: hypothetical protein N3E47_00845 [Candidatus Bathyarchaeota archaeon]|nr:hypothetical protein [Candidatus Bathyarchaeota archaeon]